MASENELANSDPQPQAGRRASGRALPWLLDVPRAAWERRFLVGLAALLAVLLWPLIGRVPRAYVDDS